MARTRYRSKSKSKSRSKSKRKTPSPREIHNIRSNIGYSPTIPAIIKNVNDIKKIGKNMHNIKNTLVAVTAKWCGACHSISDRLNNAIKNSNNGTRIDETLLDKFNSSLNTSIQPPHFPYFIVINESGKVVKVLKDIDAVEEFLGNTSNEGTGDPELLQNSMNVNNQASIKTSAMNKNINAIINNNNNSLKKNNVNSLIANSNNNSFKKNNINSLIANSKNNKTSFIANNNKKNNNEKMNSVMNSINQSMKKSFFNNNGNGNEDDEEEDMDPNKISIMPDNTGLPMKMESVGIPNVGKGPSASFMNASNPINLSNSMRNATRPNVMSDIRMNATNPTNLSNSANPTNLSNSANPTNLSNSANQAGGCLYEGIATAAYNLAPPAALLGIAAATLSRKKSRKTKRRSRA